MKNTQPEKIKRWYKTKTVDKKNNICCFKGPYLPARRRKVSRYLQLASPLHATKDTGKVLQGTVVLQDRKETAELLRADTGEEAGDLREEVASELGDLAATTLATKNAAKKTANQTANQVVEERSNVAEKTLDVQDIESLSDLLNADVAGEDVQLLELGGEVRSDVGEVSATLAQNPVKAKLGEEVLTLGVNVDTVGA